MPVSIALMDTSVGRRHDQLATRYTGFHRYAKILETVVADIQAGAIQVPK